MNIFDDLEKYSRNTAIVTESSDQISYKVLLDAAGRIGEHIKKRCLVLFVCENNSYSVYSPLSVRQPEGRKIHEMVKGMGVDSAYEDGNDIRKVYRLTKRAISKIYETGNPFFMELQTYRWREHCGPNYDNNIGYRSEEEFLEWKKRDPIKLFEKKLLKEKICTKGEIRRINKEVLGQIKEAFNFAKSSPFPDPSEAFESMFA